MLTRNRLLPLLPPLLFACTLQDSDPAKGSVPASEVNGYLIDKAERPVAGALLRAQQGLSAVSGLDGWFQLKMEPGKDSLIHVFHGEYQDTVLLAAATKTDEKRTLGKVRLRSRFAILQGEVADSAGRKLRGAAISVENQDVFALSGGNSEFTLRRVLPGKLMLYFSHGEAGWGDTAIEIVADSQYSKIVLREEEQGGSALGTVVDSAGHPVADAIVSAQTVLTTRTDSLGMFAFNHLPSRYDTRIEVITHAGRLKRSGIKPPENGLLSLGKLQPKPPSARPVTLTAVDAVQSDGREIALFVGIAYDSLARVRGYHWDWRPGDGFDTSTRDGALRVPADQADTLVRVYAELVDSSGIAFTDTATLHILRIANHTPVFTGALAAPGIVRIVNLGDTAFETVQVTDPDGDPISLALQANDSSLILLDTVIRFVSKDAASRQVHGLLRAFDGSDTAWLPIADSVNFPPVLITASPNFTVGIPSEVPLKAMDEDSASVVFTLLPGYPGKIAKGSLFQWTPTEPDTAVKEIRFKLRDKHGAEQEGILPVVVSR